MSATTLRTPSYRHHKPSGQAVVTLDGRDIYLGRYGTPHSRAEFDRLLAEWLSNGRRLPSPASANGTDLSVNELALAYLAFAETYYTKRGKPTSEPGNIRVVSRGQIMTRNVENGGPPRGRRHVAATPSRDLVVADFRERVRSSPRNRANILLG